MRGMMILWRMLLSVATMQLLLIGTMAFVMPTGRCCGSAATTTAMITPKMVISGSLLDRQQGFNNVQRRAFIDTTMILYNAVPSNNGDERQQEEESRATELGFDKPVSISAEQQQQNDNQLSSSSNTGRPAEQERLRKSLDDSAKFKIRNDARFTWLAFFLVSGAYSYSCLNPDLGYLDLLGLPDGGLAGGAAGALLALASLVLFFAPELFGKKR